jgi:amphi-Trp domain-containing protein
MSRKLLKTETKLSREKASEKLHDLADKIGEGKVKLEAGQDSVELKPADQVEFELDVEEESDGEMSIEMELEWPKNARKGDVEIK